jgi:hypothetical protein
MLVGKALVHFQRLVCTLETLKWYGYYEDAIFAQKRSCRRMKHKVKIALMLMFATFLVGCTTPEQRAEKDRQKQYRAQEAEQANTARLNVKCAGYGFQRGTTAFAQCMQQAEQQQAMDAALQMQKDELDRQEKERIKHRNKCWLLGKLEC